MIILLSPSKTLDSSFNNKTLTSSQPKFINDAKLLIKNLKKLSVHNIAELMDISDKLATLNYGRFQSFPDDYANSKDTKQAIACFKGDVYTDIKLEEYNKKQLAFLQDHIRIISGLYGLLTPFDMLYPYRLEMGTNTKHIIGSTLYEFWSDKLTNYLNNQVTKTIINLASQEYFEVIDTKKLKPKVINIIFKENTKGIYKVIGLHAKRARGTMTNWIIKHNITEYTELKNFKVNRYSFNDKMSDNNNYVFIR